MAMDSSPTSPPGLHYQNVGDYYPRKLGPKPDVVPSGVTERKVSPLDKPDMVEVDILCLKEPDFPVHRKKHETDTYVSSWKILLFGGLNMICISCLLMCNSTKSMAESLG
ncbi:hypothetical protein SKAU_G00178780 [Synaphobranchus kaupii]|uniref:Uncharacterized protein n=1 Tax=Synaphobranchus kaupii TaxID=118154 RepID=A0A9Q1J142_SYNKA|nr:hypothetical protein SKAU_G00178780 [Synaphobranchus kaupii]